MKQWSSQFTVKRTGGMESTLIKYNCGLFQGDSLSPLLFYLSTAPLSWALAPRRGLFSRSLDRKIIHALFVDDLKVYARSQKALKRALSCIERVTQNIGMKLYISKCATAVMVKGVPRYTGIVTIGGQVYPSASDANPYRYLGILQVFASHDSVLQQQLLGEYLRHIRRIWRSRLISTRKELMGSGSFSILFWVYPLDHCHTQKSGQADPQNHESQQLAALQRLGGQSIPPKEEGWEKY